MTDKKSVETTLDGISKKLSVLISLQLKLGENLDFGSNQSRKRGVGDVARYLANLGLDSKEIAEIIGASLPSVRTLLTPGRKK